MEEQLISFETAKLAKEKGFDWKSASNYNTEKELRGFSGYDLMMGYNKNSKVNLVDTNSEEFEYPDVLCTAPTQSLLQKWLREVHNIRVLIYDTIKEWHYEWGIITDLQGQENLQMANEAFVIYEEALEEGLIEGLKLIE